MDWGYSACTVLYDSTTLVILRLWVFSETLGPRLVLFQQPFANGDFSPVGTLGSIGVRKELSNKPQFQPLQVMMPATLFITSQLQSTVVYSTYLNRYTTPGHRKGPPTSPISTSSAIHRYYPCRRNPDHFHSRSGNIIVKSGESFIQR